MINYILVLMLAIIGANAQAMELSLKDAKDALIDFNAAQILHSLQSPLQERQVQASSSYNFSVSSQPLMSGSTQAGVSASAPVYAESDSKRQSSRKRISRPTRKFKERDEVGSRYESGRFEGSDEDVDEVLCKQCGKVCETDLDLKKHVQKAHTASKPKLSCEQCGNPFSARRSLLAHVDRVHKRLKQHPCHKCPTRFYQRSERRIHEQKVHGMNISI